MYWKEKYESAQALIRELHKKSIQLEDIPGLMTLRKVKPTLSKNTCHPKKKEKKKLPKEGARKDSLRTV